MGKVKDLNTRYGDLFTKHGMSYNYDGKPVAVFTVEIYASQGKMWVYVDKTKLDRPLMLVVVPDIDDVNRVNVYYFDEGLSQYHSDEPSKNDNTLGFTIGTLHEKCTICITTIVRPKEILFDTFTPNKKFSPTARVKWSIPFDEWRNYIRVSSMVYEAKARQISGSIKELNYSI